MVCESEPADRPRQRERIRRFALRLPDSDSRGRIDLLVTVRLHVQLHTRLQLHGSNGVWQNSRVNPPLPSRCGLDIAVVLDLSASVGATNLPILKSATDQLVDAFVGTPSRMAVFGFARYSPNQNATTNEIYPKPP
ncbi:hypothetical protein GS416_11230 [Rhodococcus hoagii]|nr:hypothetical protein [Prescottella equi]